MRFRFHAGLAFVALSVAIVGAQEGFDAGGASTKCMKGVGKANQGCRRR